MLSGVLVGRVVGSVTCAWIREPTGRDVEVFWPDRWRVEFQPLAVFDEKGAQVIKAGDVASIVAVFSGAGSSLCPSGVLCDSEHVVAVSERY